MTYKDRTDLRKQSVDRIKKMEFGDPITNVCAGDNTPNRNSYFAEYKIKSHKNKFGVTHREHFARCTNRKGKFWETDIEFIFPGHLNYAESDEIFSPIHEVLYRQQA